MILLTDRALKT